MPRPGKLAPAGWRVTVRANPCPIQACRKYLHQMTPFRSSPLLVPGVARPCFAVGVVFFVPPDRDLAHVVAHFSHPFTQNVTGIINRWVIVESVDVSPVVVLRFTVYCHNIPKGGAGGGANLGENRQVGNVENAAFTTQCATRCFEGERAVYSAL